MEQKCGNCTRCVEACPVSAFTGRNFMESEPRELRFDAAKCDSYYKHLKAQGKVEVCGMCLYACPYGKNRK
ncbi:MAG: 4Fe-4S dicluster domain-containing protein [Methanomassiliicoccales archaeon]|nr:4Fe-4S dicluster domain-containing protein [Methanomassiliicoccales archaeon]